MNIPAIATLRAQYVQDEQNVPLIGQLLADKGIDMRTVHALASWPSLLSMLLGHLQIPHHKSLAQRMPHVLKGLHLLPTPQYQGTLYENRQIDASIWQKSTVAEDERMRRSTWRGAAAAYCGEGLAIPTPLRAVRVLIIGAGPAGIMAARALANLGFTQITILEKTGKTGGVWERRTLKHILQAVPFSLSFERVRLEAGPRPGGEVTSFLNTLVSPPEEWRWPSFPQVLTGEVVHLCPGDLEHQVTYLDEYGHQRQIVSDIVINAIGVGEPLVPNYSGALTTDIPSEQAGIRWQQVWSEEEARRYHARKLVFVSLSNATLSMLWQIHHWNRQGMEIDYRVISHYPEASLLAPSESIEHKGRAYQLYRDLTRFQLLRVAGDMHPFRQAFLEARDANRILPHARHWTLEPGEPTHVVVTCEQGEVHHVRCDTLFTLIGYAPRAETLEALGLVVTDRYMGIVSQDYDGEAQREPGSPGRSRIFPGYFCLGIRNGYNDNEVLLPGILYRLPLLVAGVLFRAAECVGRK